MSDDSRSYRTQALILKRRDFGESDRLITLLTPDYGKLDAVAKGARKPASTKTGHVELYTRAEVLLAKGRELSILVQAQMVEPFLALREDLTRGAYASYCAELLDRLTANREEHMEALFALLDVTFARLCNTDDLRRVVRYYELRLLDAVGFRPQLSECVITQHPILPEDQFFSFAEGGVVSTDGAPLTFGLVPLPLSTLKVLRHYQRSSFKQLESLKITPATHRDVERILLGYIRTLLQSQLQSVDFIRRVEEMG